MRADAPAGGSWAKRRTSPWRRFRSAFMIGTTYALAAIVLAPLALILFYLVDKGARSLSPSFFTALPKPVGEAGGGMANAIVGTLILIGLATAMGVPIGVGAGVYLAERKRGRLATTVRFLADVLNGLPSVVMGIFAWELIVRPMGHFSAFAGGVALAAMMVPTVTRTTEEIVRVVPNSLREAALALAYPRWRASLRVVLPAAAGGIVTGVMVAMARIAGETAPLLFTAFGNQFWSVSLNRPIAALPLQIFNYAISAYDEWHALAWAGALVLIMVILLIGMAARFATRRRYGAGE